MITRMLFFRAFRLRYMPYKGKRMFSIFLAYLAGIATLLNPCVLLLLPIGAAPAPRKNAPSPPFWPMTPPWAMR